MVSERHRNADGTIFNTSLRGVAVIQMEALQLRERENNYNLPKLSRLMSVEKATSHVWWEVKIIGSLDGRPLPNQEEEKVKLGQVEELKAELGRLSKLLLAARERAAKMADPEDMFGEDPGQIAWQAFDEADDRLRHALDEIKKRQ